MMDGHSEGQPASRKKKVKEREREGGRRLGSNTTFFGGLQFLHFQSPPSLPLTLIDTWLALG